MKVMKFGGTSVGSVESLLNLRNIVNAEPKPVLVVVSAMGGFTNQLLQMCEQAQQRDISCLETLEAARKRHHDAIDGVVIEPMRGEVHATIDRFIDESLKPYYLTLATNPHMSVKEIERICDALHTNFFTPMAEEISLKVGDNNPSDALDEVNIENFSNYPPMLQDVFSTGRRPNGLSRRTLQTWPKACMSHRALSPAIRKRAT